VSILNPLFELVAWILIKIHAGLAVPFGPDTGLTWVLSIVILVVGMRVIMLPLFIKQVKSQRKMQAHMPQMRELQKRYKNDKQKQQEEMMKFYKENGINPLGGCLPLVAQLPVFWSLFNVLEAIAKWNGHSKPSYGIPVSVVQSALHAKVFGVSLADKVLFTDGVNVSLESKLVIVAFVLVSSATTFLTMRQSQKRGMLQQGPVDPDNPAANMQKYMMYISPLFALTGLYWQFGLVIYWVTTNVWTLGQQFFLFRNLPVVDASGVASATAPATSGGTKSATARTATGTKTGAPARSGAARTGTAAKTGAAKTGTAAKTGAAARSGAAAKTGTAAKTGAAKSGSAAKTGTAAKKPANAPGKTAAQPAGGGSAETSAGSRPVNGKPATAKSGANGSGTASRARREAVQDTAPDTSGGNGARKLLPFGKGKAEPEPEPVPETRIVRQQPVRQTRSKRSGKR
jgi:YidC/Oxa1 family membrane protein insertase